MNSELNYTYLDNIVDTLISLKDNSESSITGEDDEIFVNDVEVLDYAIEYFTVLKKDMKSGDNIKSPNHYFINIKNVEIENIDLQRAMLTKEEFIGAMKFNVNKYIFRAGKKDGESDLKDYNKSRVYLDWLIEILEESND